MASVRYPRPVSAIASDTLATPLPDVTNDDNDSGVVLVLSGVDETLKERTWRIAEALKPPMGEYKSITFRSSSMTTNTWSSVLYDLYEAGVKVRENIHVLDTNLLRETEVNELDFNAKDYMLGGFHSSPKDYLWMVL
ncbi:hypothetical protein O3P69_012440 [Scylla paramamosain]|uniref:Uncharacterized protein n=1 Tax=Scylla paramamosain TaxID=85552 RepID=A0AAW0SG82_SCYPA